MGEGQLESHIYTYHLTYYITSCWDVGPTASLGGNRVITIVNKVNTTYYRKAVEMMHCHG